jgi:hypothetical protein
VGRGLVVVRDIAATGPRANYVHLGVRLYVYGGADARRSNLCKGAERVLKLQASSPHVLQ